MISDQIKKGKERAPHRSLLFACGMKRDDMKKPFIGICNSYESFVPGHCHLNKVGEFLKECVIEAGGVGYGCRVTAYTAGQLKLHDVEPKTAAMIMAIVADTMGKPLNELRFISIKEVK